MKENEIEDIKDIKDGVYFVFDGEYHLNIKISTLSSGWRTVKTETNYCYYLTNSGWFGWEHFDENSNTETKEQHHLKLFLIADKIYVDRCEKPIPILRNPKYKWEFTLSNINEIV